MASGKRKKMEVDGRDDNEMDEAYSWSDEHFVETLQTVLGRYYYRSTERLQMKVKPPCYSNLEACSKNHWKSQDITIATHTMQLDCRMQQSNKNFSGLFSNINNFCLQESFPGPDILTSLLQIILSVSEDSTNDIHDEEPPSYVLNMAIQTFEMVLMYFPPCILQLEPHYSTFLTCQCKLEGLEGFASAYGIIPCIVNTLEQLLEADETAMQVDSGSADTEEELRLIQGDGVFEKFRKKTKLERIHLILHLIVKLMEFDLVMWMLRHPKKASESMLKPQKQPLIGKILWPHGDFTITPFMKKCFKVFVRCIRKDLPEDQLAVFGRLIGLILNAVNLCEMQTTSEVQYPCIRQKSTSLADTFMQIITGTT
uniref:Uncharacterized protein n=1 Tax=Lutzomyia longipalpis TaxID=7200 RepID=A0A1B0CVA0_LUTLO